MLRSLWIAFSTLAVANLLALLGFAVWLNATDRLNPDRLQKIRAILATTIADEHAHMIQAAAEQERAAAAEAEAAKIGKPPLTAEQRLDGESAKEEIEAQNSRRVQRETTDLINTLVRERAELDRQRAQFQAQVDAFAAMRARIAEEEGSEQFQKAVQVYQSVKPAEAKNMMSALIASDQIDQVVSYLDALSPRVSSKIITEFEREDPALASDLIERLRSRGTAVASPSPSPAQPIATAPPKEP
ncbi:MAG: hypothetical protein JNK58_10530 [Phycisphaerae bacterium]|nr:hypothetical protein [Phycisphaerae bacterium]